jgi:hypothetical protein
VPNDTEVSANACAQCIFVAAVAKKRILEELDTLGINRATVFADFDNIAKYVMGENNVRVFDDEMEPTIHGASHKTSETIPLYDLPVSAGTGEWLLEGADYELVGLPGIPRDADFALRVRGDSMEPLYCDGEIVFVKKSEIVEGGHAGVFRLNGEGYLKKLQGNKLVSVNLKYEPITINKGDEFTAFGQVVGKVSLEEK